MLVVFYSVINDVIRVSLHVKTNAQHDDLRVFPDSVQIWIKQAPVKGKANKEIIKYLARILHIHKNAIRIVHGTHSTTKIVEITMVESDFLAVMQNFMHNS